MKKSFLVIQQHAPFVNHYRDREFLDMVMAITAFEQPLKVLFIDKGIDHLIQSPPKHPIFSYHKTYAALPFYGVESVYVEQKPWQQQGLEKNQSILPISLQSPQAIDAMLAKAQVILKF